MLSIKSSELHVITESLYRLTNIFPFPLPLRPWQLPFYFLFLGVQFYFLDATYKGYYTAFVFLCLVYFTCECFNYNQKHGNWAF